MFDNPQLEEVFKKWSRWAVRRGTSFDEFLTSKTYQKYTTIASMYSCNDEAEREALEVPLQKAFIGPSYILPPKVTDTRLSNIGSKSILMWMNVILGTNKDLSPEMHKLLRFCRHTFEDFGQAYACLRPRWHLEPLDALENVEVRREEDKVLRSRALKGEIVVGTGCPPRRIWDLWSNRVVPLWVVQVGPFSRLRGWIAISHSWMDDRHGVRSSINGYKWPVPIPVDTTLERIRIELLNLLETEARTAADTETAAGKDERLGWVEWTGSFESKIPDHNLVWLDVLCLRQEGLSSDEDLRKTEWKLDVPTIGPIYKRTKRVVYYFSGLGRPFRASPSDKKDPRHWMNRAWTLQETHPRLLVAGRSPHSPGIPYSADLEHEFIRREWQQHADQPKVESLMTPFYTIASMESVWSTLSLMRHRSASNELDRISGLIFRFNNFELPLPAYIVGGNIDDAWDRLMKATLPKFRAQLFYLFPDPGNGKHAWYPSWQQVTDMEVLPTPGSLFTNESLDFDEKSNTYSVRCFCFERCWIEGLSEPDAGTNSSSRRGRVHVLDKGGKGHDFPISVDHKTSIVDGYYTLVGYVEGYGRDYYWVVGSTVEIGFIKKISVIQFNDKDTYIAVENIGNGFGKSTVRLL